MEPGVRSSGPSPWLARIGWVTSDKPLAYFLNNRIWGRSQCCWGFFLSQHSLVLHKCPWYLPCSEHGVNFLLRAAQLFHLLFCQLENNQIQLNWNHYKIFLFFFFFLALRKNTLMITLKIFYYSYKDQIVGTSTQRHSRGLWGILVHFRLICI